TLFPSSSLGTQVCRSSSFDSREAVTHPLVPKLELGNEGEDPHPKEYGFMVVEVKYLRELVADSLIIEPKEDA
ncbi:MAG: hypothetical protein SWC40_01880, partial [Thermodesulfobacteriota bacterium]|nr:hypothetical protein [Thermodesulfobacteriota bacterium]